MSLNLARKAFVTRCYPNKEQRIQISRILKGCRFVRNQYILDTEKRHRNNDKRLSYKEFAKEITQKKKGNYEYEDVDNLEYVKYMYEEFLPTISTKAIKDALKVQSNAYKNSYNRYVAKGEISKIHMRSYKDKRQSFFFIRDGIRFDCIIPGIINIPILGHIRIGKRDYYNLPSQYDVTSGRIIKDHDKYYVMFLYTYDYTTTKTKHTKGIGMDLGISKYATLSITDINDKPVTLNHFFNDKNYIKKEERVKKLQRVLAHKVETNYGNLLNKYLDSHDGEEPSENQKNIMKGESYKTHRIFNLQKKIHNATVKLNNYRNNCIWNYVGQLIKLNPKFITVEDLNISELIDNSNLSEEITHRLHDRVIYGCFYTFKLRLIFKASMNDIEIRVSDKYYPSTQICSKCGNKLENKLTLRDRIFNCPICGNNIDRDYNAAINLRKLKNYEVLTDIIA